MKIFVDGQPVGYKRSLFKGGEVFLELEKEPQFLRVMSVNCYVKNSDDVMALMSVLKLALENGCTVYLYLPYMPYARQDRKMNPRQANQAQMFWKLLSTFSAVIEEVHVSDVHSNAAIKYTYGLKVINTNQKQLLSQDHRSRFAWIGECDAIVAPDAGAYHKAKEVAEYFKLPLIACTKVRAPSGEIIETSVEGDTKGKRLVVVDDIVDGGRTFLGIADKIQDAKELNLVCTHGIFSYGKELLQEKFNKVEAIYDWTKMEGNQ